MSVPGKPRTLVFWQFGTNADVRLEELQPISHYVGCFCFFCLPVLECDAVTGYNTKLYNTRGLE